MSFAKDRIQYKDVMDLNPPVSRQQIEALFQMEQEIYTGRKSRWKRNQNTDI